uniref:Uncharacterized protein n=1 Tax=Solanum tuberosum TaxID=4113 RepID=M1DHM4_SOLTU
MHAPIINEHNKGLDDLVDQDELGGDEYAVKEEIDIDCTTIAKDNNEEPSKSENFIATRTNTGKEIQADTQVPITELRNRQNYRETNDNAFRAVFGKEQPSPLKCYVSFRKGRYKCWYQSPQFKLSLKTIGRLGKSLRGEKRELKAFIKF